MQLYLLLYMIIIHSQDLLHPRFNLIRKKTNAYNYFWFDNDIVFLPTIRTSILNHKRASSVTDK